MRIPFSKMHGAGNDYVVVDCSAGEPVRDWAAFARYALDRHRGVGGDQLLLVQPASQAAFFMGIRNADGSLAEMCGNGLRAFTKYLRDRGLADADEFDVETLGGVVRVRWLGPDPAAQGRDQDRVELRLFPPILEPEKVPTTLRPESGSGPALEVPLELDGRTLLVSCVSIRSNDSGPGSSTTPRFPNAPTSSSLNFSRRANWYSGPGSAGSARRSPAGVAPAPPRSPRS